uniref:Mitochondrial carrier 2 n=1 Tax=Lygus hesperus TaxID=30085 RepID=A0A0A9YYS4_LYGHE
MSSQPLSLSSLGIRLCVDTLTHPLEYAKFLIQIGHEPLAPYPTKTIFGRPTMGLPNVFKYVKYIKTMDGFSGCFRGVVPKLMGRTIGSAAATTAVSYLELDKKDGESEDEQKELSEDEKVSILRSSLVKDIAGRTCLVFVSHPFLVISNRMMAQFVGGEDVYSGFFSSIREILREQGISGFFSGVMPRWVGDLLYVGVSSLVIYGINNYLLADYEFKSFTTPSVQYLTSTLAYQFYVVSSCMSVNNCGLVAGIPPNMPIYKSWWSCRQHLAMNSQLNRGHSLVFRYYLGPPAGSKAFVSY